MITRARQRFYAWLVPLDPLWGLSTMYGAAEYAFMEYARAHLCHLPPEGASDVSV